LIDAENPWLETVVRVASLNEDHAFVIINGEVSKRTAKTEGDNGESGGRAVLLDLERVLELSRGLEPELLDAYLDPAATSKSLRDFVERQKKQDGHGLLA